MNSRLVSWLSELFGRTLRTKDLGPETHLRAYALAAVLLTCRDGKANA